MIVLFNRLFFQSFLRFICLVVFFNELFVNMVKAGEAAGNLHVILYRLADYMTRQNRIRARITAALTYPVIMIFIGISVVVFLLSTVVPKVTAILKSQGKALPLSGRPKVYVENVDKEVASQYADVVETPQEADFAILRLSTPFRPMGRGFLEQIFHQGDLDFEAEEKAPVLQVLDAVPTVVDIYLERGAVIPEIAERCAGLLASFSVTDDAVLDVVFGQFNPGGKLPFEMPRSMAAVRAQKEDLPHDSQNPLFPFGHGLRYEG